jgi:secretion/DNA translocation related TadE-like protein
MSTRHRRGPHPRGPRPPGPGRRGGGLPGSRTGRGSAHHPRTRPRRTERERGSASVWAVVLIGLASCAFAVVLGFGTAVAVRHTAGSAADLAALAAADRALDGEREACAWAAKVAAAQRARLVTCRVAGEIADVTVQAPMPRLLGTVVAPAEVRSRAGPPAAPQPTPGGGPAGVPRALAAAARGRR